MQILLAEPYGFCAGVERAVNTVEYSLKKYGTPIYVYHDIVHNRYIVNNLRDRGVIFVEKISEVPEGSILIFSAHGVSQSIRNETENRNITILDATCPLVSRLHARVLHASNRGEESILIGHAGHAETEGTMGQYNNSEGGIYLIESLGDIHKLNIKNETKLSFVTQTTFSIDDASDIVNALRRRFPKIVGSSKSDICYATKNRQNLMRVLVKQVNVILVVGSINSSNSNRLIELAQRAGKIAYLINDATDIQEHWIKNVTRIGISSSASAPSFLVQKVIVRLKELGGNEVIILRGNKENITFKLPKVYHTKLRRI